MIDGLIRWSLANRVLVLLTAVVLVLFGLYTSLRMPVDVFPDLTAPSVTVITEAHGMAPTEVESQVTFPIESALNGATGVRRVRSSTAVGISIVWVEFDWGTDIRNARQTVNEKLSLVAAELPPEIPKPILGPVSSIMGELLFVALTSTNHSPIELRTTADTLIRRRLLAVPGVSQVTPIGGDVKQYEVTVDPNKLAHSGITLKQVVEALASGNENVSAGFLVQSSAEYLVTGVGRMRSVADIEQTVVSVTNGVAILVGEVAQVKIAAAPKRGDGSANTKPAVILGIQKQPGANTLALTRQLDSILEDIGSKLPAGMKIDRQVFRQADFISIAVRNVIHALRDGAVLVVVVVLLFLLNTRATFITLTAIPISLVTAVLILQAFGATINTMTLGGMAIAIGALVDDAVIDVENVFRRLRENARRPEGARESPLEVVMRASVEVRSSIFFATLIIVLVFLPVFFLTGVEGRLLQPLGIAYVVALAGSLLVAVTVTPVLCYYLLPNSRAVRQGHEPKTVAFLQKAYSPLLNSALQRPWLYTIPSLLLLVGALIGISLAGRSFLPEFNEGALTISAVTLPGTPLRESSELGLVVERVLLTHPEVASVARRTGRAELDEHAQGVEASELDVLLKMKKRSKEEFLKILRDDLSQVPGMNITIGQPISHRIDHMLSGTRANVAVKIFGEDLSRLRTLAEKCRAAMASVQGVVDLSVEQQMEIPSLRVSFDRPQMARFGLLSRDLAHALEASLQGLTVSRILEGRNNIDLVVRIAGPEPWRGETLGDLVIDTPVGARIPLNSVAQIRKETAPNTISREQVERKIVVSCNVAGRDLASLVEDCRKVVDPIIQAERGCRVEYGGQFESAAQANRLLLILGAGVVVGIAVLLQMAFGSMRDAALVMLNLPLALIGGVVGVFLSGGVLSVASLIGFITVFGIATRNGIMLVTHIRHLQEKEGVRDFRQAIFRGAMERLAPIMMTALAAGLALIPLALGGGKPGNEIQTPMAIVILCGLLTSMLLNMVIVPALYFRFGKPSSSSVTQSQSL